MSQIVEVKSKVTVPRPFFFPDIFSSPIVILFHLYHFLEHILFIFSRLVSRPRSKSISSARLDIRRAQQKAYGRLTRNPLVWCLVAVFIIIPNRCLIILRHPLAAAAALRFPSAVPRSTTVFPSSQPCNLHGWSKE